MDPVTFLRRQAPFDRLTEQELAPLERSLEIVYLPAGTRVLERGGRPAEHLFLVRSGQIRLERANGLCQLVEEGELFGYRSLLTGESPALDAVAEGDVLCYRFPAAPARQVLALPAVAAALSDGLAARLRHSTEVLTAPVPPDPGLGLPVRRLVTRSTVQVPPATTVSEAAQLMRAAGVSSVLVATDPPGIMTDRDLRNRVVAEGRPTAIAVTEVATRPAHTIGADATLLDAVVLMLERNVHHVPIVDDTGVVGVLTDTDVLRRQTRTPFYFLRALERAEDRGSLAGYAAELAEIVRHLAAAGLHAVSIGRVVSTLNGTLVRTLLRLGEQELGPAPTPWAWVALGSEGRTEQLLLTDQDNALVYDVTSRSGSEVDGYYTQLAATVVDGLVTCGFPPCPGGFMATNWHLPLPEFMRRFSRWMSVPEPETLLDAAIFFDFRQVAGDLNLEPLEQLVDEAAGRDLFLAHMARNAGRYGVPIGSFGRIVQRDGSVDIKQGAIGPVVALARVYALAAGSRARATLERLAASAGQPGLLSRPDAESLTEAFRFALALRLNAQLDQLDEGRPLTNRLELVRLAPLERHHLKDALLAIRDALDGLEFRYQGARLG